jgi:hypothetical protein
VSLGTINPLWPTPSRVRAAFTLRTGGVSAAAFESLNLGTHVGDVLDDVRENRRRVREALRLPSEPIWLQQVHGTDVADLDESEPRGPADAAVTRVAGRVCAVQVADCMPVLFAARDGSAVAAAHAGWRGLAAGILDETVRTLGVPASDLLAWLGPTIGQENFEVGDDVRAAFMAADAQSAAAFEANARGRWQCDLYALARRRLAALGVGAIFGGGGEGGTCDAGGTRIDDGGGAALAGASPGGEDGVRDRGDWCTYADPSRFFSFRRDGQCGRMAALIWLE